MSDAGEGFLSYTMWSNIGATADIPIKHFDVFLLSYISYEVVAVYKVFKQFIQMISLLINPVSQAILPQLSELIAKEQDKEAYRVIIKLRNIIATILVPCILICSFVANQCLELYLERFTQIMYFCSLFYLV